MKSMKNTPFHRSHRRLQKLILSLIFATGTTLLCAPSARAAITPLAVSLVPPLQFPSSENSVTGLRLSALWGHHRDVYGFDLGGIGNITDQDFVGVGLAGVFNLTYGETRGIQIAGVSNVNLQKTTVVGVQLAGLLNYNKAESSATGLQLALLGNVSSFTNVYGGQVGIYNTAKEVYGFQVGVVNVTESLHGVQIGLLNFNRKGTFYVSPILNVGF